MVVYDNFGHIFKKKSICFFFLVFLVSLTQEWGGEVIQTSPWFSLLSLTFGNRAGWKIIAKRPAHLLENTFLKQGLLFEGADHSYVSPLFLG